MIRRFISWLLKKPAVICFMDRKVTACPECERKMRGYTSTARGDDG
jgi:hypothetical protein